MTETTEKTDTIITLGGKEVDLAQAFPLDLGFIEDAIEAGVDLQEAEAGLTPEQGMKMVKMILKRCGVEDDQARKLPMSELPRVSKIIEERMKSEAQDRPT